METQANTLRSSGVIVNNVAFHHVIAGYNWYHFSCRHALNVIQVVPFRFHQICKPAKIDSWQTADVLIVFGHVSPVKETRALTAEGEGRRVPLCARGYNRTLHCKRQLGSQ